MEHRQSRVTIHMAASLDGFIAKKDGSVDWMETADRFEGGIALTPEAIADFLRSIGCYVMGARTYETALEFDARGLGWSYGDTPTVVLTRRPLRKIRETVEFYSGDLAELINERLKPRFADIWVVGGAAVSAECLRLHLADEIRYSVLPVAIGDGVSFFRGLDADVPLHLLEAATYTSGMVALRYAVNKPTAR